MEQLIKFKFKSFGIILDGGRPTDIKVLSSSQFFKELTFKLNPSVNVTNNFDYYLNNYKFTEDLIFGLKSAFVQGYWTCADLQGCLRKIFDAQQFFSDENQSEIYADYSKHWLVEFVVKIPNLLDFSKEIKDVESCRMRNNYEIYVPTTPNLYEKFLDPYMNLLPGDWTAAPNLNEAQNQRMNSLPHKLNLRPHNRLLIIGSHFGGLANYLAFNFQLRILAISPCQIQTEYARRVNSHSQINFRVEENLNNLYFIEEFDAILCLQFQQENLNYEKFFQKLHSSLRNNGRILFHFPRETSKLTNTKQFRIIENHNNFCFKDIENIFEFTEIENESKNYRKTLLAWNDNLEKIKGFASEDPDLKKIHRELKFNFLNSAAAVKCGKLQFWQVLLTKKIAEMPEQVMIQEFYSNFLK